MRTDFYSCRWPKGHRQFSTSSLVCGTLLLFFCGCLVAGAGAGAGELTSPRIAPNLPESVIEKDSLTILITDSGLGGLGAAARLEANLREGRSYSSVRLVFANALADLDYQYNQMSGPEEKARVFDAALRGMADAYHPDIILIACNTLSVIYPLTPFAQDSEIPVVGIVGFGVDMLYHELVADSQGTGIILGTATTISQGSHRDSLLSLGIPADRLTTQACPVLEGEIQLAPGSDIVRMMIEMYAQEAVSRLDLSSRDRLYIGLCCTHYGYVRDVFENVFREVSGVHVTVLDPNDRMGDMFNSPEINGRFDATNISVEVASRVPLTEKEVRSVAALLRPTSPKAADALEQYTLVPMLFTP